MCAKARRSQNLRVELCRHEDLAEVQRILDASPGAAAWSAAAVAEIFSTYPAYFLASFDAEELTGFVCGRRVLDEGEILNLAVKPKVRRKGAGSKLVEALLEVFWSEGAEQIFLEVRVSNVTAITFYRGLGFQNVGARPGYYRNPDEDGLLLEVKRPNAVTG